MFSFEKILNLFRKKTSTAENKKTLKTGFLKSFNRSRGYGFIYAKDLTTKVFVHVTEMQDKLRVGDRVKFKLGSNDKGLIAKEVIRVEA